MKEVVCLTLSVIGLLISIYVIIGLLISVYVIIREYLRG